MIAASSPYGYWLPPDISTHGFQVDRLINVIHWFMLALFVGWGIFFVYCLIRFRQRPGAKARYELPKAKVSKWAEVFVAGFEVVLLFGLSMPVWSQVKNDFPAASENPLHVHVVAEQFAWNFHYPGPDGLFGRTSPELMAPDNLIGLDRTDPAAADDVVTNNLAHLPVNRKIVVDLTSKDVIHCFWIPVMRVKQDVIPGMKIPVWFEATETGDFQVACAQLCGNNHYTMKADLTVESQEAFDAWLKSMTGGDEEEGWDDEDEDA